MIIDYIRKTETYDLHLSGKYHHMENKNICMNYD